MRNQFAGPCYRCGWRVEAGEGHFERQGRKWLIQHAGCAIAYRGTKVGKGEPMSVFVPLDKAEQMNPVKSL